MMKLAHIHGPGDLRVDEVARPEAGPDDAVVKIRACGICGSDLTYVKLGGLGLPGPMPLGHELAGTVSMVGKHVRHLAPGARVIVNPYQNMIGNGGPEGAFADYLLVRGVSTDQSLVLNIPDSLSFEHAALAEPLAVSLHGVNRADPKPGERVAVFGAGPIGLGVVVCLRHRGVEDVIVIDYSDQRLERASALGARAVINPGREDVRGRLSVMHGSVPHFSGSATVGTDVFIDVAGAPPVIPSIIEMCRLGARLTVTAVYGAPIPVDFMMALGKELSITMALGYPSEFSDALGMLARKEIEVEPIISHRFDFAHFEDAFALARDPARAAKVMVTFQ